MYIHYSKKNKSVIISWVVPFCAICKYEYFYHPYYKKNQSKVWIFLALKRLVPLASSGSCNKRLTCKKIWQRQCKTWQKSTIMCPSLVKDPFWETLCDSHSFTNSEQIYFGLWLFFSFQYWNDMHNCSLKILKQNLQWIYILWNKYEFAAVLTVYCIILSRI